MPSSSELTTLDRQSSAESAPAATPKRASWLRMLGGAFSPLRVRNYRLLLSGQFVSYIGDAFYAVALPWFMLSGGGGAQALGLVLMAYGIPRAGSVILGGMLSDRLGQRRIMLISDIARALATVALAALVASGHPPIWLLCVVSAVLGGFAGLFMPAEWSILPSVLPDDELQAGNALNTSSAQTSNIIGSGIAGAVVAWLLPAGALLLDALSFVVSALTLAWMREKKQASVNVDGQTEAAQSKGDEELASGVPRTFWELVRTSRFLQLALAMTIFMNLGVGAALEVALPVVVHDQMRAGASGYGFILAGWSIGALVGAMASGLLGGIKRYRLPIAFAFFAAQAVLLAAVPFLGNVVLAVLAMGAAGILNSLGNIITITLIQQILPRHLLGRVMSGFAFGNFGLYPLSVAIGGVVVAHYGAIPVFLAMGALLALPALYGMLQREFWNL